MEIRKADSQALNQIAIGQIRRLFESAGWNQRQIDGQMEALEKLAKDKNGVVLFALEQSKIIGILTAEFYPWNRLGQIHGLAIHSDYRKKGFASHLVKEVEEWMKEHRARGLYVDTPVDNEAGCLFYLKNGYVKDYVMSEYYDDGLDGVTFLKLFKN